MKEEFICIVSRGKYITNIGMNEEVSKRAKLLGDEYRVFIRDIHNLKDEIDKSGIDTITVMYDLCGCTINAVIDNIDILRDKQVRIINKNSGYNWCGWLE